MKSAMSDEAFRSAELFAEWIEQQEAVPGESHYQAGCLYALCVSHDNSNLERCVTASIESLQKAHEAGNFEASTFLQLKQNPALVAVRSHPIFSNFVESLESAN